jgi:DNA mismatch endonuclease, patch repair protein
MRAQRLRDTTPELALRSELHRRGLRFRVQRRLLPDVRRTADIVFGPSRVVVEVRGCFWHGCPEHGTSPKANADWWREKIDRNRARDADTDARLREAGWTVIVVWEHEHPSAAADQIEEIVNHAKWVDRLCTLETRGIIDCQEGEQ